MEQVGRIDFANEFNFQWHKEVRNKLKNNGTVWISGTFHHIFSIAQIWVSLPSRVTVKSGERIVWQFTF
ncbi:MAG: hypothetical protein LBR10_03760 [Prevotellaceae bacterium]|jgi:DNA modification methylase|nr:hypothetical protein [Prevotellaceae bacterium]